MTEAGSRLVMVFSAPTRRVRLVESGVKIDDQISIPQEAPMHFLKFAGLSVAAFLGMAMWTVTADVDEHGASFQVAAQFNTGNAWVFNTTTGQLGLCLPPAEHQEPPECWAWSD